MSDVALVTSLGTLNDIMSTMDRRMWESTHFKPVPKLKRLGQILDLPVAIDNPRSQIKNATRPLGNLPQEMLIYLQSYMDGIIDAKQMPAPIFQVQSSE